jgi:hypothetical protein
LLWFRQNARKALGVLATFVAPYAALAVENTPDLVACIQNAPASHAAEVQITVAAKNGAESQYRAGYTLVRDALGTAVLDLTGDGAAGTHFRYRMAFIPDGAAVKLERQWWDDAGAAARPATDSERQRHPWVFDFELMLAPWFAGYDFTAVGAAAQLTARGLGGVDPSYAEALITYRQRDAGCRPLRAVYFGIGKRVAKKVFFEPDTSSAALPWGVVHVEDAATLSRSNYTFSVAAAAR